MEIERNYTWADEKDCWDKSFFATEEDCIRDAMNERTTARVIWIGEVEKVDTDGDYLEDILRKVEEDVSNDLGEGAENWDIYSTTGEYTYRQPIYDEYNDKLNQLIREYIAKIGETQQFFKITNIRRRGVWMTRKETER